MGQQLYQITASRTPARGYDPIACIHLRLDLSGQDTVVDITTHSETHCLLSTIYSTCVTNSKVDHTTNHRVLGLLDSALYAVLTHMVP